MIGTSTSPFLDTVRELAPRIEACAEEAERQRRLPLGLVDALIDAGLFRLWIPRVFGGAEVDPITFARVIEAVSRVDGSTGWSLMIGSGAGLFGGYLPEQTASEIYGRNERVVVGGAFRPNGEAFVVDGGYRATGRWPLASGCQHCAWLIGGCRIMDGDRMRLGATGAPVMRILFFPAADCEIIDTWHTAGLRGTGSHDYTGTNLFVPEARSMSFRERPVQPGPLYALPTIALFATAIAAVSLGIARHAIDIFSELARVKVAGRSLQVLSQEASAQADLARAEALLRSGRAFLYETLEEAWRVVVAGEALNLAQRAMLWLAATQATSAATQAVDLMYSAGGATSVYSNAGLERCLRDIRTAGQHICVVPSNFGMVGQALLGLDMSMTPLLRMDDRSGG